MNYLFETVTVISLFVKQTDYLSCFIIFKARTKISDFINQEEGKSGKKGKKKKEKKKKKKGKKDKKGKKGDDDVSCL